MGQQRGWRVNASLAALTVGLGCAAAVVAVVAWRGLAVEAQGTPPTPPSSFQGSVTAPEGPVAGGLAAIAYIGDTVCSEDPPQDTSQDTTNGETVTSYRVKVLAAAQKEGCGVEGTEVRFEVGGRRAVEIGTWSEERQLLNLTLEPLTQGTATATPGPTEPDLTSTPEGTATEGPSEPDLTETPDGTATEGPSEPDLTETPDGTATEGPSEPDLDETPEGTATATPEATEAPETPEATPAATEPPAATEAPTPTEAPAATEAPTPTEAPAETPPTTATPTPAATSAPAATEAPAPTETGPPEPEGTGATQGPGSGTEDGGGDGTTVAIIVLAVVAGIAAIGVVVFSWLGKPPQPGGGEPVIGGGPSRSRTSFREWLESIARQLRSTVGRR